MTIGLGHYLTVAAILFTLGIFGIFLNRKNVIVILMSIELILLAVNINLVAFSTFLGDLVGQVFALLVLTVAAAEAASAQYIILLNNPAGGNDTIDAASAGGSLDLDAGQNLVSFLSGDLLSLPSSAPPNVTLYGVSIGVTMGVES